MKAKLVVEGKEFDVEIVDPRLQELIGLVEEKIKCKDCSCAIKDFFKCAPEKYVCIGVKEPFVIEDINTECTEY